MDCTRLTCPDCRSVLRPTKPVPFGKQVKCPKCGNPFFAPGLAEDEVAPALLPRKKKASGKKAKAGIKKAGGPKPPAKKPAHDDEDEESGGIYSFAGANAAKGEEEERPDIEYAPDMSIKDLRGPAQEAIVKPSNLMMLIGGLCCLSNLFLICLQFWPMVFTESVVDWEKVLAAHYKDDKNNLSRISTYKEYKEIKDKDLEIVQAAEEQEYKVRFIAMGVFIFLFIYNCVAIVGAVRMQNLESRRWGIASSIMMLLPMGCSGLAALIARVLFFLEDMTGLLGELTLYYSIGLAVILYLASLSVAVMSLRALMSQAVIDGFEYIAD